MKKVLFLSALVMSAALMAQEPMAKPCAKQCPQPCEQPCAKHKKHVCHNMSAEQLAVHKALKFRDALRLNEKQFNNVYKVYLKEFSALKQDTTFRCMNKAEMTPEMCEAKKAEMVQAKANIQKQMKKILDDAQYVMWLDMDNGARRLIERAKP
ncbi:MAG: hypothetical protein KBS40_05225 [Bacteroidales bacterium]|nr:hypothetical protein [Bacteroidales bacterium]